MLSLPNWGGHLAEAVHVLGDLNRSHHLGELLKEQASLLQVLPLFIIEPNRLDITVLERGLVT
tara:strand:- start:630 stop:818 length:189 start_codon:yes stop_codon:yes gene_type:complete